MSPGLQPERFGSQVPELPEVETIRRDLEAAIVRRRIVAVSVLDPKLVRAPSVPAFCAQLEGATLNATGRRGKYLLLSLERRWLVLHLMMTGRILLRDTLEPLPHTRLVMAFDRGPSMHFVDTRRFGQARLVEDSELATLLHRLGPEPVSPGFQWQVLREGFRGRTAAVKSALLDQRTVAGLGNIYADESLWLARIHPATPAGAIGPRKLRQLADAIVTVLLEAIAHGGTSFRTYENVRGRPGSHRVRLKVFQRTGQPCPRCGRPIRRIVLGQRGTHFCSRCQRRSHARPRSP